MIRKGTMLKKPNIVVQSRGVMTTFQHRIFCGMLFLAKDALVRARAANKDVTDMNAFCSPFSRICELGGAGDKNLKRIQGEIEALAGLTCVYVNLFNEKEGKEVTGGFAFLCAYELRDGILEYQLPFQISRRLLGDEHSYSMIDLYHLRGLKSVYARYLYVLLNRVRDIKFLKLTLNQFRECMGVDTNKAYSTYANLKKRVILPAIQAINEQTDINVAVAETKKFRSKEVADLKFSFSVDAKKSLHLSAEQQKAAADGEARRKHIAKAMKLFHNMSVDPDFARAVQAEVDDLQSANPRLAHLTHQFKITRAMETLGHLAPLDASSDAPDASEGENL